MLMEFFKFDLAFQLRRPLLWLCALELVAVAFAVTSSDIIQMMGAVGGVNRNAPVIVARVFGMFSLVSMFAVTMFIAGAVLRDSEAGIADMLFATPMRKRDYLLGRFGAGLFSCVGIFVLVAVAMMIGPMMPWVDQQQVGPFQLSTYVWPMLVLVIPNLLFIAALLMLLAATTRSMMMVYVGVVVTFALWAVAGTFTGDIDNEWIAVLADPFGLRALGRTTRYYSNAQANTMLPALGGYLLVNRLFWSGISVALLGMTVFLFKPQHEGTGKRWFGKAKVLPVTTVAPPAHLLRIVPAFSAATPWQQCWHLLAFDVEAVFKSVPLRAMLLVSALMLFASSIEMGKMFGTSAYPMTHLMIELLNTSFNGLLTIVVTFYAGELIFKERDAKIADVSDAMPMPNWVPLLAKVLALAAVVLGFVLAGVLAAVAIQLRKGGAPIEGALYLQGALMGSVPYLLIGACALFLQVLTNNKFFGYLLVVLLFVAQMSMGALGFSHKLYNFGALPLVSYSDMNGFGHFLQGWSWFALYWSLFAIGLLIVTHAFWVRGLSFAWPARLRQAARRLKGSSGIALAACTIGFAMTGGWIFHNTNGLNKFETEAAAMDRMASYEKSYRRYKDVPQPKITAVRAAVDIYPAERRVAVKGSYVIENKTGKVIDTLYLQVNPDVVTTWTSLPAHKLVASDKAGGFSILKLVEPLHGGARLALAFTVDVRRVGFSNDNRPDTFNLNGTFFNNREFFPNMGYQGDLELADRHERRKRGLGERARMAKLEDTAALSHASLGSGADWIDFETTVSTSGDQIALAPGYLKKSWQANGRNYFEYKMDQKMAPFFAYLSANWEVKKGDWKGVPIEIYYDKKHAYNVDRMIASSQKSLDYFSTQFTPYQHKQVRILEFPNYQAFAQSFANTIPYSESVGFIADLRNKDDIDYVFYVTAHELAHQWWGHQVMGADVQGASMLVESLAEYS
ncbi:MAG: M1 family aminopeptidase, partial [Telluria sp.]